MALSLSLLLIQFPMPDNDGRQPAKDPAGGAAACPPPPYRQDLQRTPALRRHPTPPQEDRRPLGQTLRRVPSIILDPRSVSLSSCLFLSFLLLLFQSILSFWNSFSMLFPLIALLFPLLPSWVLEAPGANEILNLVRESSSALYCERFYR